ncbi:MAG: rhomboid family intramembrane serine protease [Verrucomicrobiales bacterium]|nr:rhomboid family intramembrane serine protease [Verrucomicrobiales bacterium]
MLYLTTAWGAWTSQTGGGQERMRLIGYLDNQSLAEKASGLLFAQGIRNQVEPEEGPGWALWIHAEEDIDRARQFLAAFRANPEDPAYRQTGKAPEGSVRDEAPRRTSRVRRSAASDLEGFTNSNGLVLVTLALVVMCGLVALMTQMGTEGPLVRGLQISEVMWRWRLSWELFLPEVRHGEVWRLLSPAFLHFGWPHLLFNLWTFWDLGRAIEYRQGSWKLVLLIAGLGVISNLGQYFVSGPRFGGMSGVIYGLFGYVWMLGRYRPSLGLGLHPQTVVLMLVWFVICLSGSLGVQVANTAHGVGLVVGVIWGRLAAREAAH